MNFNLTLWGQAIALAIFVWICMRYIWPHIINGLKEREKRVADGLAAGEEGQRKLEQAEYESQGMVDKAKEQAAEIIAQAQKRGDEIVEEAKDEARTEGEHIINGARSEIDQERMQAKEQLREEVAMLALAGAEQILMREVDKQAHNEMLAKVSAEL